MKRWMILASLVLLAACSSASEEAPSPVPVTPAPSLTGAPSIEPITGFTAPPTTPLKTYGDDTIGFSVQYPKTWKPVGESSTCPAVVCFPAPAQNDQVPAVITVNQVTWSTPTNLQTAWNTKRQLAINSLGVQPRTVPGTQGNTTLAGEQAKTATYTMDWGLIPATARQTMVLGPDGTSAIIVSEVSATEIWNDLDPTFKEIEGSFTLGG